MKTELLLDNRTGTIYDIPHGEVTFKTSRQGRAGSLTFNCIGGDMFTYDITPSPGDVVLFRVDGTPLFYGYVFTVKGEVEKEVTCYDQIRYLKNTDSFALLGKRVDELISLVATLNYLKVGTLANTGYALPKLVVDNKSYLDAIYEALEVTLMTTGRSYLLRDNVGALELLDLANTHLETVIDGDTLLMSYEYEKDIDSDTYNRVKLLLEGESVIAEDSSSQSKWGRLQYHEALNDMTYAQAKEKAEATLKLKNRAKQSLSLKALGDSRCVAGFSPYVILPKENLEGFFLIDTATHTFKGNSHTMALDLVVV